MMTRDGEFCFGTRTEGAQLRSLGFIQLHDDGGACDSFDNMFPNTKHLYKFEEHREINSQFTWNTSLSGETIISLIKWR